MSGNRCVQRTLCTCPLISARIDRSRRAASVSRNGVSLDQKASPGGSTLVRAKPIFRVGIAGPPVPLHVLSSRDIERRRRSERRTTRAKRWPVGYFAWAWCGRVASAECRCREGRGRISDNFCPRGVRQSGTPRLSCDTAEAAKIISPLAVFSFPSLRRTLFLSFSPFFVFLIRFQ